MVLKRLRHSIERFFRILDSEGVALFQAIVYIHLAIAGAYCALVAGGVPETIQDAVGEPFNTAWLWLCIAVTVCLVGKLMAREATQRFWLRTAGLYFQFVGDAAAMGAFYGYVLSTIQESNWGKAVVAAWVFAALGDCALLLVWRDVRRIDQEERRIRQ